MQNPSKRLLHNGSQFALTRGGGGGWWVGGGVPIILIVYNTSSNFCIIILNIICTDSSSSNTIQNCPVWCMAIAYQGGYYNLYAEMYNCSLALC